MRGSSKPFPFGPAEFFPVCTRRSTALVAPLLLAVLAGSPAWAQKKVPNGAKVLFLTGGQRQHHGYRDQAFYLTAALEDTGRYQVTMAEDAAILETPALKKYDLIIVNADRRDPEFKFTASQQEAVRFALDSDSYANANLPARSRRSSQP